MSSSCVHQMATSSNGSIKSMIPHKTPPWPHRNHEKTQTKNKPNVQIQATKRMLTRLSIVFSVTWYFMSNEVTFLMILL
jgi:hypothetical protein